MLLKPVTITQGRWTLDRLIPVLAKQIGGPVTVDREQLRRIGVTASAEPEFEAVRLPLGAALRKYCCTFRVPDLTCRAVRSGERLVIGIEFTSLDAALRSGSEIPCDGRFVGGVAQLLDSTDAGIQMRALADLLRFGPAAEPALALVENLATAGRDEQVRRYARDVRTTLQKQVERSMVAPQHRPAPAPAKWNDLPVTLKRDAYALDEIVDRLCEMTDVPLVLRYDDLNHDRVLLVDGPPFGAANEPLWDALWRLATVHDLIVVVERDADGSPIRLELAKARHALWRGQTSALDERAVAAIIKLLDDDDRNVVILAIQRLGRIGAPAAIAERKLRQIADDYPEALPACLAIQRAVERARTTSPMAQ